MATSFMASRSEVQIFFVPLTIHPGKPIPALAKRIQLRLQSGRVKNIVDVFSMSDHFIVINLLDKRLF